jgi:hypothetical protein
MKQTLLKETNFDGLKELIKILTDEHPLVLIFEENEQVYVELTNTESSTRYRFWWNQKDEHWQVERRGG